MQVQIISDDAALDKIAAAVRARSLDGRRLPNGAWDEIAAEVGVSKAHARDAWYEAKRQRSYEPATHL
jgi:hypothetical protein